jgi:hypothetical protein
MNPYTGYGFPDGAMSPVMAYGNGDSPGNEYLIVLNEHDGDNPDRWSGGGIKYTEDTWMTEEFKWQFNGGTGLYTNGSDAPADGIMQYYRNGSRLINVQSIDNGDSIYGDLRLFDNFTPANTVNDTPAVGSRVYMTYLYADTVYNRIMVGNHSTLATSTKRMVVIPSAWSSTSVSGTLVLGSDWQAGDSMYAYVVNGQDSVNAIGYGGVVAGEAAPVTTVTTQPRDTTVNSGTTATFLVSGDNINTYQWYGNGSLIPNATSSIYSFTATYPLNGSTIYCIVNDTLSSDTVTLTVNPPFYSASSTDTLKLVCNTVGATSYQWYKNNSVSSGETNRTITLLANNAFYTSKASIYCIASNGVSSSRFGDWQFLISGNNRKLIFKRKY